MITKTRILSLKELIGDASKLIKCADENGPAEFETTLIYLGEVRKSGAKIYFRPYHNDFECHGKHFVSYNEAYQSQNW